jgi:hypothetical protein
VQSRWLYGIWHERMGHCVLSSVCDRQTCCRDAVAAFGGEGASCATAKPFKAEAVTCLNAPELGSHVRSWYGHVCLSFTSAV